MIWFCADTHFDWPHFAEKRGFDSVDEHDSFLLSAINSRVQRTDRLFILGDFCSKDPQKWRMKINCREVNLIFGNHDKPSWHQCFSHSYQHKVVKIHGGLNVVLFHHPIAYWDGSHNGWGHLYGHVHQAREETLDRCFPGRRSFDVSVDALIHRFGEFRPINEVEVSEILLAQPGHDPVEFYR